MSQDNININVQETNDIVNIVSSDVTEVIDINVGETVEEVTLNITEEVIQVNINKITSSITENLQQVTNNGNHTTNPIIVENGNYYSIVEPYDVGSANDNTGTYTFIGADGIIGIKTDAAEGDIKTTNLSNNLTLEFPDKTGSKTIATTEDIPTATSDLTNDSGFITAAEVPTVNDATDTIKGILKLTNDLGGSADAPTVPNLVNKVPYTGATSDVDLGEKELTTGKLYLYDAAGGPTEKGSLHYADEALHFENSDGETLMYIEPGFMQLHKTGAIQSNFFFSNLTTNRDHYLPDASGTIALTSDITGTNSGVNTGDETISTIKSKLGITTLSGSNTGDQDLSNLVVKNATITGATKTKITYDSKGLVTSGADATTADIADSTNKRYVTDANLTTIGNQSGTNTGDETTATIKTKLGAATTSVDGYLTSTNWNTFNNKQNALVYNPYRYLNTTLAAVTGTVAETIVATATISANTFNANDVMKCLFQVVKSVTVNNVSMRIKINTSNTLTGATQIGLFTFLSTNAFTIMQRNFNLAGGNIVGYPFATSIISDIISNTATYSSITLNPANTFYIFFTIQMGAIGESSTFLMANITN